MVRWLGFGGIVFAAILAGLWLARRPLTEAAVRSYLGRNGVDAAYRLTGATRQRLVFDDVRLGTASRPDLVARRVTLDLGWFGIGPQVRAARIEAPRLRARLTRGGVSFGSLDRLIPPGRTERFPAIELVIVGGIARVAVPMGEIIVAGDAGGRLDRDFRAVLRTEAAPLRSGACRAVAGPAVIIVTTRARDFAIDARGAFGDVACAAAAVPRLDWSARLAAPLTLASVAGAIEARAASGRIGPARFSAPASLRLSASGFADAVHGPWQLAGAGLAAGRERAASITAGGDFRWHRAAGFGVSGTVAARGVTSATLGAALADSRLPGIGGALARRVAAVSRRADIDARFTAAGLVPAVTIAGAEFRGIGGARMRFGGGSGAAWSAARTRIDGTIAIDGGGLPAVRIGLAGLEHTAAGWRGSGVIAAAPWRSGGESIAVPGMRFAMRGDTARIAGRARASLAIAGGHVEGLDVRLAADIGLAGDRIGFGPGCADVAAEAARFAAITTGRFAVQLCPLGFAITQNRLAGGIAIGAVRLRGVTQGQAFALATGAAKLMFAGTLDRPAFHTDGAALRLELDRNVRGVAASAVVSGGAVRRANGWAGSGGIAAVAADLPGVRVRAGRARWQLAGGVGGISAGEALVTDRAETPRFAPLRLARAGAVLSADSMTGRADIRLDAGDVPLLVIAGRYAPRTGTGSAQVDSTLVFNKQFQPLMITELARGAAANVEGKVVTHAELALGSGGITGTARVRLDALSLATASLGPVGGIDGTLVFDDLPRLHTPAHQQLKIASINPGVLVEDGVARFAIIDAATIAIESVRWPFTGGTMTVQPVTLRAGQSRRAFDLVVDGLDAGQFLQRFDLKNLNATGTFDGVLPLVFEGSVGRIEGGRLTARAAGGTIQYVGNVGQDSMGAAARLAFDALRRLRYRSLTLALDGDLDGELVTAINFAGTNEQSVQLGGNLPIRASGLPFKFAVTVRAPFRALLGTVASFSDARGILRAAKPQP